MKRIILFLVVLLLSAACSTSESCRRIEDFAEVLTKTGMIRDYSLDYKIWYAKYRWEALAATDKVLLVTEMAELRNQCVGDPVVYVYRPSTASMLAESTEIGRVRLRDKSGWEEHFVFIPEEESTSEQQNKLP